MMGFWPARVLSYNANARTLQLHIPRLTDGAPDGITAQIAYPMGDDDRDTELRIEPGLDVWVFFEGGDPSRPVAFASRGHGTGAEKGTRRIRQEKIELLADESVLLRCGESGSVLLTPEQLTINAGTMVMQVQTAQILGALQALTAVIGGMNVLTHMHTYQLGTTPALTSPPIPAP